MQVTNLNGAIKQITVGGVNYSLTGSSYMGTTAEWSISNYVPAHGELIIYNDDGKLQFKIGDGETSATELGYINPFGATVIVDGGEAVTDTGRVEVLRDFETYSASNRKFAAYDYNGFFAKDKLANDGKPLAIRTLVWTEPQLDAYSNQNTATDLILEDYQANPGKYYYDAEDDRYYRNIFIHYPLKDGQVAIIEHGGVLRAANFEGDNVDVGATHTDWLIFGNDGGTQATYNRLYSEWWKLNKLTSIEAPQAEATFKKVIAGETRTDWFIFKNDEATMGAPNRMFNDSWQLSKVFEIKAPGADTWLKNVHSQAVYTPWVVFDNDGGTAATYNRLYDTSWWLTKLKTIDAPIADAKFKSVKVDGNDVVTVKKCTRTTRPTETIAGELWYEEDTGRTIRRNKNNNGWVDMMGNPIVPCSMYFDFETVVDSTASGSAMYILTVNGEIVHMSPFKGEARYQHDFEDVWSATLTMYDFSGTGEDVLPLVEGQRVFSTDDYVMHPGATIDLLSAFKRGGAIHITNKVAYG